MGPRASGKSSVGSVLAERLGRRFVDLDHETLKAFVDSPTISSAWRTHGEVAWRAASMFKNCSDVCAQRLAIGLRSKGKMR
jgi:shikimate kinase